MADLHAPEQLAPEARATHPSSAPPPADPERDLAGALHEVSNALTVVLGWIERARAAGEDPAALDRALEVAAARATQARAIVRRAIGAEVAADPHLPAAGVVADAVIGLEPELRRAGLRVAGKVAPGVEALPIAHASSVLQILTNLLLNAIAVAPAGSTVRVEALPAPAGGVTFAVSDDGPGIAPERRRTIFEAGVTTRRGGAGIGLRHAAALARSLGGALALADSPGGARFELSWPPPGGVNDAPPPESSVIAPAGRRGHPLDGSRILLVEDDDAVVELLDTALTARGADVVSIRRRGELEAALATGPFDAALFDISPIQGDISGALASARKSGEATRLVLISGSAEQMPELPADLVSAWVRKPFEISEILHAIEPDRER